MPDGRIRGPAKFAFAICFVQLAQKSARRRCYWDRGCVREELGCQGGSGFCHGGPEKGYLNYQNKCGGSDYWIRRGVTGPHRAILVSRDPHCITIALVPLDLAHLAMVQGAIDRVAARGQIGGGKRLGQASETRYKQRQKCCEGCEFANDIPQF
jgi:hypothetical protein